MVLMGPVEWPWYNDKPGGMNTDTRKTRGFIENFKQFFKIFFIGSPTASGTQNPAIQWKPAPSRTPAHLNTMQPPLPW